MAEIEMIIKGLGRVKHKYSDDSIACVWLDEAIDVMENLKSVEDIVIVNGIPYKRMELNKPEGKTVVFPKFKGRGEEV